MDELIADEKITIDELLGDFSENRLYNLDENDITMIIGLEGRTRDY
jgi:hypothetical protein